MKNDKIKKHVVFSIIGLIICVAGIVMIKTILNPQGIMRTLPYICIGIGAGIFGQNLGSVISGLALLKNPKAAKIMEEEKDERSTAIRNQSKAKAYDLMVMVFGALMLVFALTQVDLTLILAFVAAYLFVIFSGVYYLAKYQKKM